MLLSAIVLLVLAVWPLYAALPSEPSTASLQSPGTTTRVSVDSYGTQGNDDSFYPSISADGHYVAFSSYASNLVLNDTNGECDIFIHDRWTGHTTRVAVDSDGTEGNDDSGDPSISADGRYVAFESLASNLVPNDTMGWMDIFVHQWLGKVYLPLILRNY